MQRQANDSPMPEHLDEHKELEAAAYDFAAAAHAAVGQCRKYTGEPYIVHPAAVAELVRSVPHTPEMLAAALLHDVVEDTNVGLDAIRAKFGDKVADLVDWLTDVSRPTDGNRRTRKRMDLEHLEQAPPEAQTIKFADLIDNSRTIARHDRSFWAVYRREMLDLLAALTRGDETLRHAARLAAGSKARAPDPTGPRAIGHFTHRRTTMTTAADILIETLLAWEVDVIFGLPGDGINGIMEALRTRQDRMRFIQVRHEESAAFMATAYAKLTGRLGVCLATSGPGGTHLLTGLYDAKLDQAPVLAITGMQFHDLIETFNQQDVDLTRAFSDVAEFNVQVSDAAHMENAASLACRTALSRHGVAHISVANDVQEETVDEAQRSKRNKPGHVSNKWFAPILVPPEGELDRAAEILNQAQRVAMLVGRGALGASDELLQTAYLLGAPIAKALRGKAVIADDHPHSTGGIGILGTRPSQDIMEQCDALLVVGSTFPYVEYYPKPGQAKIVQIDWNPERIGVRAPVDVGLVGHAAQALAGLNARLSKKTDRSFLQAAQRGMAQWRGMMETAEQRVATPLKPQMVVHAFGKRLAADAVLTTDSGQNTELAARHIGLSESQPFAVSGALASMACGLSYAIAAGIAFPGRQICAVVGDGGFAMQLGEFSTAVRYGIPLKLLVIKNNMLNQIAWEQMMFLGNPQFGCELQPIDFARAAEAMGGKGFAIEEASQVEPVLDRAFAEPGPVVIEALVDKYEPMFPPKLPPDYRKNFEAALPGTPGHEAIERNIALEPLATMLRG